MLRELVESGVELSREELIVYGLFIFQRVRTSSEETSFPMRLQTQLSYSLPLFGFFLNFNLKARYWYRFQWKQVHCIKLFLISAKLDPIGKLAACDKFHIMLTVFSSCCRRHSLKTMRQSATISKWISASIRSVLRRGNLQELRCLFEQIVALLSNYETFNSKTSNQKTKHAIIGK